LNVITRVSVRQRQVSDTGPCQSVGATEIIAKLLNININIRKT